MTQTSTGRPLGYHGVDTSIAAVMELEDVYGSNLRDMSASHRLLLIHFLALDIQSDFPQELSSDISYLHIKAQEFYNDGEREQAIALLKALVNEL